MPPSASESTVWLVRTAENIISGPFPKEHVQKLILEGELSLQDEVCAGNSYWIALHEREEVQTQLGIEVPTQTVEEGTGGMELTQTQTDAGGAVGSGTTVASSRKSSRPAPSPRPQPLPASLIPLRRVEPPTFWRGFALTLILLAIVIVVAVLRILAIHH